MIVYSNFFFLTDKTKAHRKNSSDDKLVEPILRFEERIMDSIECRVKSDKALVC